MERAPDVVRNSRMKLEISETSSDVSSSGSSTSTQNGSPLAGDDVSTIEDQVHVHTLSPYPHMSLET